MRRESNRKDKEGGYYFSFELRRAMINSIPAVGPNVSVPQKSAWTDLDTVRSKLVYLYRKCCNNGL